MCNAEKITMSRSVKVVKHHVDWLCDCCLTDFLKFVIGCTEGPILTILQISNEEASVNV